VNLYIPHNRRTPLQVEEALGPISIPRVFSKESVNTNVKHQSINQSLLNSIRYSSHIFLVRSIQPFFLLAFSIQEVSVLTNKWIESHSFKFPTRFVFFVSKGRLEVTEKYTTKK
jgi:hypothetical protein